MVIARNEAIGGSINPSGTRDSEVAAGGEARATVCRGEARAEGASEASKAEAAAAALNLMGLVILR